MKMRMKHCCRLLCLLVICLLGQQGFAGRLQYSKHLSGTAITAGSGLTLMDDFWPDIAAGTYPDVLRDKTVRNYIKLQYTGQQNKIYNCSSTFSVTLKYTWSGYDKAGLYHSGSGKMAVSVNYGTHTATEVDLAEITAGGGLHFVKVNITSVGLSGVSAVPQDLFFETGIEVERYLIIDEDIATAPEPMVSGTYSGTTNKLTLNWPWIQGAEEYDLEWYYVNENTEDYSTVTIADLDPTAFTRITLPQNTFTLNMVFEKGKLFYRLRGVGRFGDRFEDVVEGEWSDDAGDVQTVSENFVASSVGTISDEDYVVKNWTYQQSFAEGGKHKEVVSFFDGSGRNRQSVTLSNSTGRSLVAETYYDFEGRPVISTLPAPDAKYSGTMQYFESFAINNSTSHILLKPEYDVSDNGSDACDPVGLQLKNTEGASRYYSPYNSLTTAFQQYLPDAFLYPYTRVAYDNEGRPKKQAGAGETFTMGGDHTVNTFFATPSQEALNRMFGSQVGYAEHYMLEAVEDANGQVALTYKDMTGKVVATSLTGDAPTQLEALDSNTGLSDFTQSLGTHYEAVPEPAWVTNQTIFLPAAGDYDFTYEVNMEDYSGLCDDTGGNCTYSMVMSMYDNCTQAVDESDSEQEGSSIAQVLYTSSPFVFTYSSMNPTETFTFTVHVNGPGTYVVSKRLTLDETAFDAAVSAYNNYLHTNLPESCLTLTDLPEPPCGMSCEDYCAMLAMDEDTTNDCDANYCNSFYNSTASDCSGMLDIMNADMLPNGQYFDGLAYGITAASASWFDTYVKDHGYDGCSDCSSVTIGSTTITSVPAFWCEFNAANIGWLTEPVGSWSALRTYITTHSITDASTILIPQYGGSCLSFGSTKPLIEYHPEYCQYVRCTTLSTVPMGETMSSLAYDKKILLTSTYADAVTNGWVSSATPCTTGVTYSGILGDDPLDAQTSSAFSTYVGAYTFPVTSGSNMWLEAVAVCGCGTDCDQIWSTFKGLYAATKESFLDHSGSSPVDPCSALCDNTVPADQVADPCESNAAAVGYHINFPGVSGDLYDEATDVSTDPDADDMVDAAGDFSYTCMNYIDINLCDVLVNLCTSTCNPGSSSIGNNIGESYCTHDPCRATEWNNQPFNVFINNVGQIYTYLPTPPLPTFSLNTAMGTLLDYGYDWDACDLTGFDMPTFITNLVSTVNSYTPTSGANWNAEQLDDCTVRLYNNSSVDLSGELVRIGYGTSNGPNLSLAGSCVYNVDTTQYQCTTVTTEDCACTWLNLDYNALLEENPDAEPTDLYAEMATDYNATYGTSVDAEDVQSWMENCAESHVPCLDPDGSSCIPEGLMADCNAQPEDCADAEDDIATYYENADVETQITDLVNDFKQHYIDECFGGNFGETFHYKGGDNEYHFTLYHYDQAGNLSSTVPPKGVQLVSSTLFAQIDNNRNNPTSASYSFVDPQHQQKSIYRYNSYGLVTEENVPDKNDMLEGDLNTQPNSGNFMKIQMMNPDVGYAIVNASPYVIKKTTNGGSSWSTYAALPGTATVMNDLKVFGSNILVTTDAGVWYHDGSWHNASSTTGTYKGLAFKGTLEAYTFKPGATTGICRITLADPYGTIAIAVSSSIHTISSSTMNSIAYNGTNDYLLLSDNSKVYAVYNLTSPSDVPSPSLGTFDIDAMKVIDPGTIVLGGDLSSNIVIKWMPFDYSTLTFGTVEDAVLPLGLSSSTVTSFSEQSGVIYAVGDADLFLASSDYGLTWMVPSSTVSPPSGVNYNDLSFIPGTNELVLAGNGNTPNVDKAKATDQRYYYDQLGRIKASQNSKQNGKTNFAYSYSVYDAEGRVTEAGEAQGNGSNLNPPSASYMNDYANWPGNWLSGSVTQKEVTRTVYDLSINDTDVDDMFIDGQQNYLRKRVSTVMFYNDLADGDYQYASHYSYDVHGNVNEFVREYKPLEQFDQRFKKFEYIYDLVSGNTNAMKYQTDPESSSGLAVDGFIHKYEYDADNRLIFVSTTRDGLTWDNDAKYLYYLHGPMGRMEIGEHKVQGMDYAYTINGNLKGVNSAALDAEKDMGQDGKVTHLTTSPYWSSTINDVHQWMARDAFGYGIGYFGTDSTSGADYVSITAAASYGNRWLCKIPTALGDNLYNGNIRHVVLGLIDESEAAVRNRATAYKHDQLQRLKHTYNYYNTGIDYSSVTSASWTYLRENVSYDANGNINSLQRYDDNATTPALMDDFVYRYNGNTNRLNYVVDNVSTPGISTDKETQSANNYAYDEIGQLTADNDAGITDIVWNVRNKPTHITESSKEIYFEYDEMGHRVKKEIRTSSENNWTQQWYVMDPQGNPVAVYEHKYTNPSGNTYNEMIDLKEHQIYGSDRLGTRNYSNYHLWEATFTCSSFNPDHTFHSPSGKTELTVLPSSYQLNKRVTGNKYYELKNHTNNVQSVVSDYKIPYAASCSGITNVTYYKPDVITYTDYFVFGGTMNNRHTGGNTYRYGFNGQEKVDEIEGNGNHYTAEYWEMDPRLGRRWNLDPIVKPYQSGYSVLGNNPIIMTDPLGNTEDWYEDDKGNVRWFNNDAKEVYAAPTKEGKEYSQWKNIGKTLHIETSSYIDKENDIPAGGLPTEGEKYWSLISISGKYDKNKNFIGFEASFEENVGKTFNYIRGASAWGTITPPHKDSDGAWRGGIWRHTQVPKKEAPGLYMLGGEIVDVNQKIDIAIGANGYIGIYIGHGTYPSLKLDVLNTIDVEYQFLEHSFILSHGNGDWMRAFTVMGQIRQQQSYYRNEYYIEKMNKPFIIFTGYTAGDNILGSYPHLPLMPFERR